MQTVSIYNCVPERVKNKESENPYSGSLLLYLAIMTLERIHEFAEALGSMDAGKLFSGVADDTCTVKIHLHIACLGEGMWYSDATLDGAAPAMDFLEDWLKELKCLDADGNPAERLDEITFIKATVSLMSGNRRLGSARYAVVDKNGLHLQE